MVLADALWRASWQSGWGIPYYDKELLTLAAKESGICEEMFEDHDEKPTRSLLFSLVTGMQMRGDAGGVYMDMPLNHKIFLAQFDTIRNVAAKGPCVIVGRCADYVLRDEKNVVSVFIKADMEERKARAVSTTMWKARKRKRSSARRTNSAPATTTTTLPPPGAR